MNMNEVNKEEFGVWLNDILRLHKFSEIKFEITGKSGKGDGYIGDLVFLDVTAKQNKETKNFNVVMKYGKPSEEIRKEFPIREAFKREILTYRTIFQKFRELESQHNVKIIDTLFPKYFGGHIYDNQEVLLLQNMTKLDYQIHDRFHPFNLDHLKLSFENYERKSFLKRNEEDVFSVLQSKGEVDMIREFRKKIPNGYRENLVRTEKANEKAVLIHGDCWNNNFMFKYNDSNKMKPAAMVFIDLQMAELQSPAIDLTSHLYSTASQEELNHTSELISVYYESLSSTMRQLGSDPEIVFPYNELLRQWKKYSLVGLLLGTILFPFSLVDSKDAKDLDFFRNNKTNKGMYANVKKENEEQLSSRVLAIIKHYLEFDVNK
ncbi:hypothetical protein ABEB36_004268 [Hypothenemus hampei]|uniref:CHK kinase-like domain-containing protein n=1 Tax=Hypothenemus hampei TaxID=57062 RepID=A0ABD1F339_HYPHA